MKTLAGTIVTFCTFLVLVKAGEPTDIDQLQGTWLVTSLTESGKAVPKDELDVMEIIVEKEKFTVNEKGKTIAQYQIKLDTKKTPKHIDFTHLIGEDKGKTEPGIYAVEKDQIKFCMDDAKKGRPEKFEGPTLSILTLKKKPTKE